MSVGGLGEGPQEYILTIINKLLYTFDELLEEYINTIIPQKT